MGIDAVHTKYSTWDGAAKMKRIRREIQTGGYPHAL